MICTSVYTVGGTYVTLTQFSANTKRYGDIDARYAAEFPAVVKNPITKAKNSISSRLRSNPTYKLVDQLEKTPPRKSWSKNKNNQSEKSAAQSFFTRLVSRLSPAQSSFSSTPVGRISQSFTNYLDKRSADGKSSRRANSPLIPRRERTFEQNPPGFDQPTSVSEICIAHVERETKRFPIGGNEKFWKQLRGLMRDIKWTIDDPKERSDASLLHTTVSDPSGGEPSNPTDTHYIEEEQDDLEGDEGDFSDIHEEDPDISIGAISEPAHPRRIFLENTQTLIQFLKKLHKIQSIHNFQPELIRLQYRLNNFPRINWTFDREEVDNNKTLLAKTKRDLQIVLDFLQAPPPPHQSQIVRQAATPCHAHSKTRRAQRYRQPRRHLPDDRAREGPSHFQSFRQSTPLRQVHYPAVEDDTRHNLLHINERFNHVVRF
ncbi:hypothetical protein DAPPUDRAFT_246879 [Daphnia pulex]|uniref:Uncharacterized protein n=1 Tax=Daphnia pulex TaxID=6669 RepID=E9GRD0_DAPPU|nr:hypothetical protein DAPPUDRAFT_246879 [Daphnia pulex]|eukprot:EFX78018.1 hypothetical protein DAPPUDRAFT_246879 [Daphnia pulex]